MYVWNWHTARYKITAALTWFYILTCFTHFRTTTWAYVQIFILFVFFFYLTRLTIGRLKSDAGCQHRGKHIHAWKHTNAHTHTNTYTYIYAEPYTHNRNITLLSKCPRLNSFCSPASLHPIHARVTLPFKHTYSYMYTHRPTLYFTFLHLSANGVQTSCYPLERCQPPY